MEEGSSIGTLAAIIFVDTTQNDVRWSIKSLLIHELELDVANQVIGSVEMTMKSIGHLLPGAVSTWLWCDSCAGSLVSV